MSSISWFVCVNCLFMPRIITPSIATISPPLPMIDVTIAVVSLISGLTYHQVVT